MQQLRIRHSLLILLINRSNHHVCISVKIQLAVGLEIRPMFLVRRFLFALVVLFYSCICCSTSPKTFLYQLHFCEFFV